MFVVLVKKQKADSDDEADEADDDSRKPSPTNRHVVYFMKWCIIYSIPIIIIGYHMPHLHVS